MRRRVRTVLLVVLALLVAGAAVLLFLGRARLDDARSEVDTAWSPLRAPLSARYLKLAAVSAALRDGGGGDRAVSGELQRQLERWGTLQEDEDTDVEAEVRAANDLEGSGRRLAATVRSSARLEAVEPLGTALAEYQGATIPAPEVQGYNDRVREYQDTRDNTRWSPSASLFGFDARSALVLAG